MHALNSPFKGLGGLFSINIIEQLFSKEIILMYLC